MTNHTKEPRIRAHVDVKVSVEAGRTQVKDAYTINISLSGMLIKADADLPVGNSCTTQIVLMTSAPIFLSIKGHIIRKTADGYAISFDEMGLESLEHLKRLVAFNAPDPSAAELQSFKYPGFKS